MGAWSAGPWARMRQFGTDRQQRVVLCRPRPSDDHGHRLDLGAAICRSCWGMITIRSGSTPRRHRPRSAASSAVIATVGSSSRTPAGGAVSGANPARHRWPTTMPACASSGVRRAVSPTSASMSVFLMPACSRRSVRLGDPANPSLQPSRAGRLPIQEALAARSWVLRKQKYHFAACYSSACV